MATTLRYKSREGDTVDLIAWRHYGRTEQGIVERLLDTNPGLADHGPLLPAGLNIELPPLETPATTPGIRLWS